MIPKVRFIVESCVKSAVKEEMLRLKEKRLLAGQEGLDIEWAEEEVVEILMACIGKKFSLCDNVGFVVLRNTLSSLTTEKLSDLLLRREIADYEITNEQRIWLSENAKLLGTKRIWVNVTLRGEVANLYQAWAKRKA